jgi:MATE family multidrug resistance protein
MVSCTSELLSLLSLSLPVTLNMLFYRLPWLTSLYYIGKHDGNLSTVGNPSVVDGETDRGTDGGTDGETGLSGAALASTIANVTGLSIVVGLNSALTTLVSQSVGSTSTSTSTSQHGGTGATSPITYLHRALLIHYLSIIPISCIWLRPSLTTSLLTSFNQSPQIAELAATYLRALVPGLYGHTLMFTLTPFCQSLSLPILPATTAALAALVHVFLNQWLVLGNDTGGVIGAAHAMSITQILGPVVLSLYMFGTKHGRDKVAKAMRIPVDQLDVTGGMRQSVCTFEGIKQYLKLSLPSLLSISEWWASEIAIFWSGSLTLSSTPETSLSAMTLYQSINSTCFMVSVGYAVAVSTRIGVYLGAGDHANAKKAKNIGVTLSIVAAAVIGATLFLLPHETLPSLFTTDADVIAATARTIPLLSTYVFADGVQVTLSGVMKGIGMQRYGAPIVVLAYWIVGLPVAHFLGFGKKLEVRGLVGGMTAGTWVHMLCMFCLIGCGVDWIKEAGNARARVMQHGGAEEENTGLVQARERDEEEGGESGGGALEMTSIFGGDGSLPEPTPEDDFFAGMSIKNAVNSTPKKKTDGDDTDNDVADSSAAAEEDGIDVEMLASMGGEEMDEEELRELKESLKMGL